MTLYFVTGNEHKFREVKEILPNVEQLALDLHEVQHLDPREVARAKLEAAHAQHKGGSLFVEDVSLHLGCLGGFPGPLVKWLLKAMGDEGIAGLAKRLGDASAQARSTIGYMDPNGQVHFFEGTVDGTIVEPRGKADFGWDPIFMPAGRKKTFAQMGLAEKNKISHRAQALGKLKEHLAHHRHHVSVFDEKVTFKSRGNHEIRGVLSLAGTERDPIVVITHGLGSDKDSSTSLRLQGLLNDAGISTLRFDFIGHGESGGAFSDITPSEGVDNLERALAFLKGRGYKRIGLVGSSFSGYASYAVASKHPELFALALKCPVANFAEKGISTSVGDDLATWKKKGFTHYITKRGKERLGYNFAEDAKAASAYELAPRITMPVLIVQGSKDKIVTLEQAQKMASTIPSCMLAVIDGADHRFSKDGHFKQMVSMVAEFLVAHAGEKP
jgi:non-canonical purine NTP pyrophosphatase (RdgB/HAM1 family)